MNIFGDFQETDIKLSDFLKISQFLFQRWTKVLKGLEQHEGEYGYLITEFRTELLN